MASIYKKTRDKGRKGACWYIGYVDHRGNRQTRRGFADRGATEQLAGEIAEDVRLVSAGLKAPRVELERLAVAACLAEFREYLENRDNTASYITGVMDRVTKVMVGCGIKLVNEITATCVSTFLAKLRREGNVGKNQQRRPVGKTTSNHLSSIRQALLPLVSADAPACRRSRSGTGNAKRRN